MQAISSHRPIPFLPRLVCPANLQPPTLCGIRQLCGHAGCVLGCCGNADGRIQRRGGWCWRPRGVEVRVQGMAGGDAYLRSAFGPRDCLRCVDRGCIAGD
jgi:hypothetical protein